MFNVIVSVWNSKNLLEIIMLYYKLIMICKFINFILVKYFWWYDLGLIWYLYWNIAIVYSIYLIFLYRFYCGGNEIGIVNLGM